MSDTEALGLVLQQHQPTISATYSQTLGPRGGVTGCTCMPIRDYLSAGNQAGLSGWTAHLHRVLAPLVSGDTA